VSDRILLIEDDNRLAEMVRDYLDGAGFRATRAATGAAGLALHAREAFDAIVLDLMLPDVNGYQVCEELRRFDAFVPILMLTARSQEVDKIRGLDAGADDYVTKPFSVGELIARLRALLRRANRAPDAAHGRFKLGACEVDLVSHEVARGDRREQLSFYEVELLRFLHERAGQPVAREEILTKVWGVNPSGTNRTVDNFIVKLRRKVEDNQDKPRHILTVYGYGYKLVP
jgi:DNA-binding response OmpR family regulator